MMLNRQEWSLLLDKIKNNQLVNIDLSKKDLSNLEAIEIAKICTHNTTIKSLNLTYNKISDEGLSALAQMLNINRTLVSLRLGGNIINNNTAHHFLSAIRNNPIITSFSIYPKRIGDVDPGILSKISNLLAENLDCPIINLLNCIKTNDPELTMIDLNRYSRNPHRIYLFDKEFKIEFKKALIDNYHIKKLILNSRSVHLLEFCPIEAYKYLHAIEIQDDEYSIIMGHLTLITRQIKNALFNNKNLIEVKFPQSLFQYRENDALLIEKKIRENYQKYQYDEEQFINSLFMFTTCSKYMPLMLLTRDILFYLFCYIFSDNIIYQQMERQKMSLPFFNKLLTPKSERNSELNSNNIVTKRTCLL